MPHDGHARAAAAGSTNPRMDSWRWKTRVKRARAKAERDPAAAVCWICHEPIDMALPAGHRDAFTLDHLTPLSRGGDIDGPAEPAHRRCNSGRGDGRRARARAHPPTLLHW